MPDQLRQDLQGCSDAMFILESALHRSLQLTGAPLGNIQLMDWRTRSLSIVTQHGFNDAFLRTFRRVTPDSGSACGRAIRTHAPIVIGDVLCDPEFAPYRALALENGFRAVQSTPLVSSSGAFLGVVSTHFPVPHRPSDREMLAIARLSEITANALIRQRAIARATDWRDNYAIHMQLNDQLERARTTVERSHKLLQRLNHKSLH
jgi:GAF domain-containing protein